MKTQIAQAAAIVLLLLAIPVTFAGDENFDLDTRFRAKIAKEKVRQAANERRSEQADKAGDDDNRGGCGSQNIGNIDTNGRPGRAPREVFIFAPNAINIVGRGGCR